MSDNASNHSAQEVDDETSLILGGRVKKSLSALHPSPLHIFKIWQTFLENINPLIKILHGPTIQQQLLDASGSLDTVSKEFEALMFSIYCIALVSMRADDVQNTYGETKAILLSRYHRGARLAFTRAGILRTSKIVVLQAFVLYLLSMRASSDPHAIWSLCGVAVRIAQRIGLHRDGSQLGLSVFETEMRRRLWRQLAILDVTTAQSSGITSQLLPYFSADIRPPSNVNDSELDPRMTDTPREHNGATEMIFVLARNEFGEWMKRWSKADGGTYGGRGFLISSSLSLEEKDQAIDELNNTYKGKFLQYCDNSIPLHYMTASLMQAVVSQMRFTAHHPRQYGEKSNMSPSERDYIFSTCLKIIEGFEDCQSNEIIQRYLWHVDNHIPWDALIYMLHDLRTRIDEGETKRSWMLIDRIYSRHYDQMGNRPRTPLHIAMQSLIMTAWKAHSEERTRCNRFALTRLGFRLGLKPPCRLWVPHEDKQRKLSPPVALESLIPATTLTRLTKVPWIGASGMIFWSNLFMNRELFSTHAS
ncbi:fungal-specific transcription factor domain-containing protein [Aspergillus coremiiformis]|uniref:Fungal-specific transcription factor domain-containing protein n=1 Tax=Aspergillus coremiiformis TaxID=138285 RepID=A0A5N6ZE23_9EURO|nr:fungal-specific transcription factor domain-containing protein [Aspergillus coremiiformis]